MENDVLKKSKRFFGEEEIEVIAKKIESGVMPSETDELLAFMRATKDDAEFFYAFHKELPISLRLLCGLCGLVTACSTSFGKRDVNEPSQLCSKFLKEAVDNFKKVLKGIRITSLNMTSSNLTNLALQRRSAMNYGDAYMRLEDYADKFDFGDLTDYCVYGEDPIVENLSQEMKKERAKVLALSKKYKVNERK